VVDVIHGALHWPISPSRSTLLGRRCSGALALARMDPGVEPDDVLGDSGQRWATADVGFTAA
jgi:hypothetical protein